MTYPTTCPFPENINYLSPNGFLLSIKKLPELSYFSQTVDLPDVSIANTQMNSPLSAFTLPGDQIEWNPLNIQFLVDEEMKNYQAIFNWIVGLGFPEDHDQFQELLDRYPDYTVNSKSSSDGFLQILSSNNVAVKTFMFTDLIPISLGTLQFNTMNTDVPYLVGNVSFKYTNFNIVNT